MYINKDHTYHTNICLQHILWLALCNSLIQVPKFTDELNKCILEYVTAMQTRGKACTLPNRRLRI